MFFFSKDYSMCLIDIISIRISFKCCLDGSLKIRLSLKGFYEYGVVPVRPVWSRAHRVLCHARIDLFINHAHIRVTHKPK